MLAPRQGDVVVKEASAELALGDDYRFYGPEDTRTIVVDMWENPAGEADGVLGMVMPADATPQDRSWGAILTYEDIGWVSAEDARTADYDALLSEMQAEAMRANDARRAGGFPTVTVTGWAQQPRYDSVGHTVSWGRRLSYADGGPDGLHYDLRLLGRHGVLSLNIVATMDQIHEVRAAADELAKRASFEPGHRYGDFDEARDDVAGYGIAGLVATGAGVAVAKNVGLLAMLAKFAQPIGIALLVLAAAIATLFRKISRRKERATR